MGLRNSPGHYGAIALSFHWITVALVIIAWALGSFDDVLPRGPARAAGLLVHISAGIAIMAMLVVAARVAGWRSAAASRDDASGRMGRSRRPAGSHRPLRTADRRSC